MELATTLIAFAMIVMCVLFPACVAAPATAVPTFTAEPAVDAKRNEAIGGIAHSSRVAAQGAGPPDGDDLNVKATELKSCHSSVLRTITTGKLLRFFKNISLMTTDGDQSQAVRA